MITVTHNASALYPEAVLGYSWDTEYKNLSHEIIGSSFPAITFRPAGPRTGTLNYFCLTEDDAQQLSTLHKDVGLFSISDDAVPSAAMTYVPMGTGNVVQDETRTRWTVSVGFKEVI